jgi:hypothetical protein
VPGRGRAGWNLAPLLVLAAAALWLRDAARDRALLATLAAAAAGVLVATSTIVKPGTRLNVLVPSEPLLATLAVAGVVWTLRTPLRCARRSRARRWAGPVTTAATSVTCRGRCPATRAPDHA